MSGMTLFETLLVLTITILVTVSGVIGLSALQSLFQLRSTGDEIRAQLQYGRELAIANKGGAQYRIGYSSGSVILSANGSDVSRFQVPGVISFSPSTFDWGFAPVTGELTGCSLPCTLGLTMRGNSEIIIVRSNGIIE